MLLMTYFSLFPMKVLNLPKIQTKYKLLIINDLHFYRKLQQY